MDDKRRLQIPAKWRPAEESEDFEFLLVIWQLEGQEKPCLLALPPVVLESLVKKINDLPFGDLRAETLRRLLTQDSESVTIDSAGRICLPQRFADAAGIMRKATLVGMVDRFQIWNPEYYKIIQAQDAARKREALALI